MLTELNKYDKQCNKVAEHVVSGLIMYTCVYICVFTYVHMYMFMSVYLYIWVCVVCICVATYVHVFSLGHYGSCPQIRNSLRIHYTTSHKCHT